MKKSPHVSEAQREQRAIQGYVAYELRNDVVEVVVVPKLGAKVLSLKNLRTGREWMWHPRSGLKLFTNQSGDDFSASPLAGIDECLPTIAPCNWRRRNLPDHGEVWSAPWDLDAAAWEKGIITTRVRLRQTPFDFERSVLLNGKELRLEYRLQNRGSSTEDFLWALHPLLKIEAGDRLELPDSTRSLLPSGAWTNSLAVAVEHGQAAKLFLNPLREGQVAIVNPEAGDRLEFCWDPAENSTLGIWLTRGGWNSHHHLALEPTNGQPDSLDVAANQKRCGSIRAGECLTWHVRIRLNP